MGCQPAPGWRESSVSTETNTDTPSWPVLRSSSRRGMKCSYVDDDVPEVVASEDATAWPSPFNKKPSLASTSSCLYLGHTPSTPGWSSPAERSAESKGPGTERSARSHNTSNDTEKQDVHWSSKTSTERTKTTEGTAEEEGARSSA